MGIVRSEHDPLLPSYSASPEINSHQHGSREIFNSGDISALSFGKQRADLIYDTFAATGDESAQSEPGEQNGVLEMAMSRVFRTIVMIVAAGCLFAVVAKYIEQRGYKPNLPHLGPSHSPHERAIHVLESTPLIDGHNDLAIFIRARYRNKISSSKFRDDFEHGNMPLNVDLPRLKRGHAGGAFWSAFVVCPANASYDMRDENFATAVSHTLDQIDLLKRLQAQYPMAFSAATADPDQMMRLWQENKSLFGPISIEGLHQIPPSAPMSTLRHFYALGVRMATLTWNCHNPFADAALVWNDFTEPPVVVNKVFRPEEGAVTRRGRQVLREMNRLGMIVDLSHTSYWTQKAVLSADRDGMHMVQAPVVFSHSSAYSLCPHPRNVKDDILDLVKKTKSVVMVNFSPDFISCTHGEPGSHDDEPHFSIPDFYERNNTLHQVARHVVYIGERIGYDHVGLGSDFDGMGEKTPDGLDGVDKYPDLVAELLRLGVSEEAASKIVGGNVLRVWKAVDETSRRMSKQGVEPEVDDAEGY